MKLRISFLSDTHTKYKKTVFDLPGGDLLIHSGDISSMGYSHEVRNFLDWFSKQNQYAEKIFIAGNHDWMFADSPTAVQMLLADYPNVQYLQDEACYVGDDPSNLIKVYGSPWQPWFLDWAFNLPHDGWEIEQKWNDIDPDTQILITHTPPYGYGDLVVGRYDHLGCDKLRARIETFKPKIHVFGHIHTGAQYSTNGHTHFINASVLDEHYEYTRRPVTIDWNPKDNEVIFISP